MNFIDYCPMGGGQSLFVLGTGRAPDQDMLFQNFWVSS